MISSTESKFWGGLAELAVIFFSIAFAISILPRQANPPQMQ